MSEVLVEDRGPIRRIILSRPEVMNAITGRMLGELNEALKAADDDASVRGRSVGTRQVPPAESHYITFQAVSIYYFDRTE